MIYPAEVSLRWTDGISVAEWVWYIKINHVPEDQWDNYLQTSIKCGFKKDVIAALDNCLTYQEMMIRLKNAVDVHFNAPIYCTGIDTKAQWLYGQNFANRLRNYEHHMADFRSLAISDDNEEDRNVNIPDLVNGLSKEGRCALHKQYDASTKDAFAYKCCHENTLRMKTHWMLYKNLQM